MRKIGFNQTWMARCKGNGNHAFISSIPLFQGDAQIPKFVSTPHPIPASRTPPSLCFPGRVDFYFATQHVSGNWLRPRV